MIEQAYFARESYIAKLRTKIGELEFSTPEGFGLTPAPTLRAVYNGIGPDRWSRRFRKITTAILAWFEPSALIHDWEYTYGTKTYWRFTVANARFAFNAAWEALQVYADAEHRWRKTLKRAAQGLALALLCQAGGYKGYKSAVPPDEWRPPENEETELIS
ncbi:MAG: hypothetical protein VB042_08805 [Victivallaceae bacterium]|nr:hypothetical protein [Victivallaceae bacterium]